MSRIRAEIEARFRFTELVESGRARELREKAHLSSDQAARHVGQKAGSTLTRWERGERTPRGRSLRRYVRFLDQIEAAITENGHAT